MWAFPALHKLSRGDKDEKEHVATDNEDDEVHKGDKGFKMKRSYGL